MGLLPGAALHDVNRLMLPVLPFLAGLAGAGFFALTRGLAVWGQRAGWGERIAGLRPKVIGAALLATLVPPAIDLVVHHPYEFMFVYYQRHGRLRSDVRITDGVDFDHYLLLNRPSAFREDRVFLQTRPVLRDAWCLRGAPLVLIYAPRAAGTEAAGAACDGVHQGRGRKVR
jgi:hypothetical protein